MRGILKIGMTTRTSEIRLVEANRPDTWRPPTPYKIELKKKVLNPVTEEKKLHNLLRKYRINPDREFFDVPLKKVRKLFDQIHEKVEEKDVIVIDDDDDVITIDDDEEDVITIDDDEEDEEYELLID
jgi:hypothetical protein